MKTVICSHGFGVGADGRGMFTDIANALPSARFIMFDYNRRLVNGDMVVSSLDDQATALQAVIDANNDGSVLLCHSQGCIIAGLVDLRTISSVIMLAPPVAMSMQRVVKRLEQRPGATIDLEGVSKLPRTDGTTTHIPKDYVMSLAGKDPVTLYEHVASIKPLTIIRATRDNVLGETSFTMVPDTKLIELDADHDFSGAARNELISTLATLLA